MTVTLTANYKDVLAPETVTYVDSLVEEDHDLQAILVFIDEHSEDAFMEHYPLYVELGEEHGYGAVDAFLELTKDPDELDNFTEAYLGEFLNPRDMAEEFFQGDGDVESLDCRIVVDWEETAYELLRHDVDRDGDYYFRCAF